jgi:ribonucleoside-diphosphate reductase alpha chain
MRVLKRDGKTVEPFKLKELRKALLLGFAASGVAIKTSPIEQNIVTRLHRLDEETVTVEQILDATEEELMASGWTQVAKGFILYRESRNKVRAERLRPDSSAISDFIHVSKYAKYVEDWQRRELYHETVARDHAMHTKRFQHLGSAFLSRVEGAFAAVHRKEVLPSMRSMQFGGVAIEKHNARMYNCCFTHINRPDVFSKIFYLLLCGCGVGYSVQTQHVEELPPVKHIDKTDVTHWTIKDNIEGWGDAIEMLMASFFLTGRWIEFAYHEIRPQGSPLKTSGGKAPGHLGLREAIEAIRKILLSAQGRSLRPIECHDILCHLSVAVLSGGIRRSAMIALFSPGDTQMVYCKAKGEYGNGINKQREQANNTAVFLREDVDEQEFRRIIKVADENYGDPGFLFVNDLDHGVNPCGEIGLHPVLWADCWQCEGLGILENHPTLPGEGCDVCYGWGRIKEYGFAFCNLSEVNCAKFQMPEDFFNAVRRAAFIGTLQADYTSFPYLGWQSEEIAKRDALLGVSLTGVMDCPEIALNPEYQRRAANIAVETNREVAKLIGINPAQRVTTVKPSGTASLELGCVASGIHLHHAERYFRRVTGNLNEPPVQEFMRVNPHMVERKPNGDVALVFPVQAREGAITIEDVSALDFVEKVMSTFENWVKPGSKSKDLFHSVSCTVTLREGEREDVVDYIWENRERITNMSFVPHILDKLYPFAPREAVKTPEDETYWNRLIEGYRPIDWTQFYEKEDATVRQQAQACMAGGCDQ